MALTPEKGVHQFRFVLSTMRTPNSIVVSSCMYAFLLKCDSMRTPPMTVVHIGSHLIEMHLCIHQQTTIDIHEDRVPKLVYTLFWCKPVNPLISILHGWKIPIWMEMRTLSKFHNWYLQSQFQRVWNSNVFTPHVSEVMGVIVLTACVCLFVCVCVCVCYHSSGRTDKQTVLILGMEVKWKDI